MTQTIVFDEAILPEFMENIIELQKQVGTANLSDLAFIKEKDQLLSSICYLREFGRIIQTVYIYSDERLNRYDFEAVKKMLERVEIEASKARNLLRQAALQATVSPEKIPEFRSRLRILMESLYLLLASLKKATQGWVELPLLNSQPADFGSER